MDVLQIGQQVESRYRIEKLIARSNKCEIYLALDTRLGRQCILKIWSGHLNQKEATTAFTTEAMLLSRLSPTTTIVVYDQFAWDNKPVIVLEYAPKGTLASKKKLSFTEAMAHMLPSFTSLGLLHAIGYVHRDYKPENTLGREDGTFVLSDLGDAVEYNQQRQGKYTRVGTVRFAAPEQQRGEAYFASDVYSLAVTLFGLVTGTELFTGHVQRQLLKHLREAPNLSLLTGSVPPDAIKEIERALAKNPQDRHQSAAEFHEALLATMQTQPSQGAAKPTTLLAPTRLRFVILSCLEDEALSNRFLRDLQGHILPNQIEVIRLLIGKNPESQIVKEVSVADRVMMLWSPDMYAALYNESVAILPACQQKQEEELVVIYLRAMTFMQEFNPYIILPNRKDRLAADWDKGMKQIGQNMLLFIQARLPQSIPTAAIALPELMCSFCGSEIQPKDKLCHSCGREVIRVVETAKRTFVVHADEDKIAKDLHTHLYGQGERFTSEQLLASYGNSLVDGLLGYAQRTEWLILLLTPDFVVEALQGDPTRSVPAALYVVLGQHPELLKKCIAVMTRYCSEGLFPGVRWYTPSLQTPVTKQKNVDSFWVDFLQILKKLPVLV